VRQKYLKARSIFFALENPDNQALVQKATPEEYGQLMAALDKSDRELFLSVIEKIRSRDVSKMTTMALRNLARQLGIHDYRSMCKDQLLILIGAVRARKILENERRLGEATDERIPTP